MLNELRYYQQNYLYLQMNYMITAVSTVMSDKKNQSKIRASEKKLRPKRTWTYTKEKDKDIVEDIDNMEKYFNKDTMTT